MKKTIYLSTVILLFTYMSCIYNEQETGKQQKVEKSTGESTPEHPKNIIFMIGDGMGMSQITAGMIAKKDALNIERCKVIGIIKTSSGSHLITDSAAGATAFSTGVKTYNGAIGVDMDTLQVPTILEIAERSGLSTGLVATSSITHATPASFIAHQPSRLMDEEIAADFLSTDIDVFIGGGKKFFENRSDGRDLLEKLEANGYKVIEGIEEIMTVRNGKLAGFIAKVNPVKQEQPASMAQGRGDVLARASTTAMNILDQNDKGFFLMIEGSQIDWGGHANSSQYIIEEMLDFDQAVGKVLDFAEKDGETLVIITADHESGGYAINGGSLEDGIVDGVFTTDYHTAAMVPVFAYGPGAGSFAGVYQNNTIFNKMLNAFGLGPVE